MDSHNGHIGIKVIAYIDTKDVLTCSWLAQTAAHAHSFCQANKPKDSEQTENLGDPRDGCNRSLLQASMHTFPDD